jgi:hypothetical protein
MTVAVGDGSALVVQGGSGASPSRGHVWRVVATVSR